MAVLPDSAVETPDPAAPRRRVWRRVGLAVAGTGLLALIALFWPGWPLHPLAAVAAYCARSQGLELHVRSPWLRLHPDLTAQVTAAEIRLGDRTHPDALVLNRLDVRWRTADLLGARFAPRSVHLDDVAATVLAGANGRPHFITLPEPAQKPAAPAFTPADLPENALPAIGRPLTVDITRTHLRLPAGLPVGEVTTGPMTFTASREQAGSVEFTGALDLRIDRHTGSITFEGQLDLVRDWLGRFQLNLQAAPDAAAPATRITLTAGRTAADQPATASLRIQDCAPGAWLALLGRTDLPKLDGRFDAAFDARGDPLKRRLDFASVRIDTGEFLLTQPAWLARPLTLSPVHFAIQTEDNGAKGHLDAFVTRAGPLALTCSGLAWQSSGNVVAGGGQLQLAAVPLADLLDWLPADLRRQLPLSAAEAAEIGLAATTLQLDVTGDRTAGAPVLRFNVRSGLALNQEQVAVTANGDLDLATRRASVKVVLPDFVQARWQLALLRRFPVPELAAPLRAELNLRGRWPDTLDEARWSIVAGQGHVIPKGPTLRWLAQPFPITSFTLTGRLHDGQKNLSIEQLDLVSGRAHLALERTELNSTHALTATTGTSRARVALKLERWYAADFLPLLGPELQSVVAPAAEDLAQIGLEKLETAAELGFSRHPWIDPSLTTLAGTQTALVRIGEELIPVDAIWKFDPATRRVAVSLLLKNLRPDRLALAALKNTPIPSSALDLAFNVNLEVSADPYAQSLDLMKLKAAVRVDAEGGRIKANPLLAADLPVKHLAMAASAQILPLRLEKLKVSADFAGPTLLIEDANLDFSETGRSGLQLTLREFPLDWAYARVPAAGKPPLLKDARLRGRLAQLALRAEFRTPTAAEPNPPPTSLSLNTDLHELGLRLAPDSPELVAAHVALSGDLDRLTLLVARASTDGLVLTDLKVAVTTPLTPARAASISTTAEADLAHVPAWLAAARPWVTLPSLPDLTGLAGQVTVGLTASTPLDPAKLATDLRAKADINARQIALPPSLLPASVRIGPAALALTTNITGQNAAGTLTWKPRSLTVGAWLKGVPSLEASYALTPQALDIHPRLDLAGTVIDVPALCWRKPVGQPAHLVVDTRYTPAVAAAPARLSANVTTAGLIISPLSTRIDADLADDRHPSLNLAEGVTRLQLRDTRIGLSTLELDASRAADGATDLHLRAPVIDAIAWISQLSPSLVAWNQTPATPAPAAPAATTSTPAATVALQPLDLPAINLRVDIERMPVAPSCQLTRIGLAMNLRDGLPASLALAARTSETGSLDLQLTPGPGRLPWRCTLIDLGGWLRTGASPLPLLPPGPLPADSPLETLRTLPAAVVGGDITMKGTLDWRDPKNTVDGGLQIDRLTLQQEIKFLSKIAALINKRVMLRVPFKVFDVPTFTASPAFVSMKKIRIEGPLTLTSDHLDLDLNREEIDMGGKVLGIGFEVAGPIADPRFYLTDKNLLIKGITQQDDFDW